MGERLAGQNVRKILREETDKAPFGRVVVQTAPGMLVVNVHTVKPEKFERQRSADLVPALEKALRRSVTIDVTPEAQAVHKYVRVPPNHM